MKDFWVDVVYKATVTQRTIVEAEDEEDAKRKIREGDIVDEVDTYIDEEEIIDFIF